MTILCTKICCYWTAIVTVIWKCKRDPAFEPQCRTPPTPRCLKVVAIMQQSPEVSSSPSWCWRRCSEWTWATRQTRRLQAWGKRRSRRGTCSRRTRWTAEPRTCWTSWSSRTERRETQTFPLTCLSHTHTTSAGNYQKNPKTKLITCLFSFVAKKRTHSMHKNEVNCIYLWVIISDLKRKNLSPHSLVLMTSSKSNQTLSARYARKRKSHLYISLATAVQPWELGSSY